MNCTWKLSLGSDISTSCRLFMVLPKRNHAKNSMPKINLKKFIAPKCPPDVEANNVKPGKCRQERKVHHHPYTRLEE